MTPHEPDRSEITEPLDLRALEPLHPRDAFRLRVQVDRDGWMLLADSTDSRIARSEYLEYASHCEAVMAHVDRWQEWHEVGRDG